MLDVAIERPSLFIASRMKRLAERMQGETMRLIQAAGLPIQPSNVPLLATLYTKGPNTIGAVATILQVAQPTVTRAVIALVDVGIIAIERGHADQRHRIISLTRHGREMWERAEREILRPLEQAVEAMLAEMTIDLLGGLREIEQCLAVMPLDERTRGQAVILNQKSDERGG